MELDWREIFERRPDLNPPGYEEGAAAGQARSQERYQRQGKRRAGKSGKSKPSKFPSAKHASQD